MILEINPSYLSSANRKRLEELVKIIESSGSSPDEKVEALREQTEIESKRKPLSETTFEEAMDFRLYLFEKYRRLAQYGGLAQVSQFQMYLQLVQERLSILSKEAMEKSVEASKAKVEFWKGLKKNDKRGKISRGPISTSEQPNPWAIDFDDDD